MKKTGMKACSDLITIPLSALFIFITLVASLGNIFLFSIILRSDKSKRRFYSNYLILLLISDNICIAFLFINFVDRLLQKMSPENETYFVRNSWSCKAEEFLKYSSILISSCATVCLTIERFLIVYFPMRGRLICRSKESTVIITSVIMFCLYTQSFRVIYTEVVANRCSFSLPFIKENFYASEFISVLCVYFIPGSLVLFFTVLILFKVVKVNERLKCEQCRLMKLKSNNFSDIMLKKFFRKKQNSLSKTFFEHDSDGSDNCRKCRHSKTKRNATLILIMISFSFLIFHVWKAGLSVYYFLMVKFFYYTLEDFKNFTILEMRKNMRVQLTQSFCFLRDIADLSGVIGYGINFYIYYIFGKIIRLEFAKLCHHLRSCRTTSRLERRCQSLKVLQTSVNKEGRTTHQGYSKYAFPASEQRYSSASSQRQSSRAIYYHSAPTERRLMDSSDLL